MADKKLRGFLLFRGGIPTGPDVDALIKEIGIPAVGDQITYERITAIIDVTRKSSRWAAVVGAWRRRLQNDHGVVLAAVANVGYDVLSDDGKVQTITGYVKRASNSLKRADRVAVKVDRGNLSAESRQVFDHYGRTRAALELAELTAAKQLDYPDPEK